MINFSIMFHDIKSRSGREKKIFPSDLNLLLITSVQSPTEGGWLRRRKRFLRRIIDSFAKLSDEKA